MSSRTITFIGFGVIHAAAAVWQVVALVTRTGQPSVKCNDG